MVILTFLLGVLTGLVIGHIAEVVWDYAVKKYELVTYQIGCNKIRRECGIPARPLTLKGEL